MLNFGVIDTSGVIDFVDTLIFPYCKDIEIDKANIASNFEN